MTLCDGDEVWVYTADNAGAGTTAEQPACTWAALWANENALRGALMVVATVAMATTMAIMAAAATGTQEVALPTRGDEMTIFDGDEARAYAADNAGAGATAGQFACTWAALWGE